MSEKSEYPESFYKYQYIAPSGIVVKSTVPFPPDKWWDRPCLHPFWSWMSWGTRILAELGWGWPMKQFKKWTPR